MLLVERVVLGHLFLITNQLRYRTCSSHFTTSTTDLTATTSSTPTCLLDVSQSRDVIVYLRITPNPATTNNPTYYVALSYY